MKPGVAVLIVVAVSNACAARRPKLPLAPPETSTQFACSCRDVDEAARQVFERAGFKVLGWYPDWPVPVMRLRRPNTGWLDAKTDVKKLTTLKVALLDHWDEFAISRAEFRTAEKGNECGAYVTFEYSGFRNNAFQYPGWYELESNGRLEEMMIRGIRNELTNTGKIQ